MSRRVLSVGLGVVWLSAFAGCIDYEQVAGPVQRDGPALVSLVTHLDDDPVFDSVRGLRFEALIEPGRDALGTRTVSTDTLWAGGHGVVPVAVSPDGARAYRLHWSDDGSAEVRFDLPRIGRVADLPASVVWRPRRKLDPDTVYLARGRPLVLRFSPALPRSGQNEVMWQLQVSNEVGGVVMFSRSELPDSLVIPADQFVSLVNGAENTWLHVQLQSSHLWTATPARDEFRLSVQHMSRFGWTLALPGRGSDP